MIVLPGFIVYIALAAVVGYIGRDRKFGFWGYFFVSLLFTPVVALLTVFASYKKAPALVIPTSVPMSVPIVPVQ